MASQAAWRCAGRLLIGLVVAARATAAPIQNPANGHWYGFYESPLGYAVTWFDAAAAATVSSHLGLPGHLVTITSREENLWLTATFQPEPLRSKWTGGEQDPAAATPDVGWSWYTGEPFVYTNWWPPGAPNWGSGEVEDRIQFDLATNGDGIGWNDYVARRGQRLDHRVPSRRPGHSRTVVAGRARVGVEGVAAKSTALAPDDGLALGADRDHLDGHPHRGLEPLHVGLRFAR